MGNTIIFSFNLVEGSDVIFAVDSIPAIFAVTSDPFIVLTANLMAILGLRAMFFLLLVRQPNCITYRMVGHYLIVYWCEMLLLDVFHMPI